MAPMILTEIENVALKVYTHPDLFSPGDIDKRTLAMLSVASFHKNDKVLDWGCGYGVVGIYASKLIDDDDFTVILSNPSYYTDFAVAKHFVEDGLKNCRLEVV